MSQPPQAPDDSIITIRINSRRFYSAVAALFMMTGGNLLTGLEMAAEVVAQGTQQKESAAVLDRAANAAEYAEAHSETAIDLQMDELHERCKSIGYTAKTTTGGRSEGTTGDR